MNSVDWKALGELAVGGGAVDGPFGSNLPALSYTDRGIPVIRGSNLSKGKYRFKDSDYVFVAEETADRLARSNCIKDDLVFTKKGTLGQVGIVPGDSAFNRFLLSSNQMRVRIDENKAYPLYVYYYLSTKPAIDRVVSDAMTTGVPKINLGYLKKLKVPCPSVGTQRKIAAILTAYDDLIENNRQRIALLEKMAEEIYREWFVRLRFPGHEHTPVHKGVPEGWEVRRMRDLVTYYIGGGWGEEQRSTEFSDPAFVIRGTDLPNIAVGDLSSVPYRYHKASNLKSRKLVAGDIVFEVSGGSKDQLLGRTAVMSEELVSRFDKRVMCASFCKLIRPNRDLIQPVVLGQFLRLYYSTGLVGTFQVQSTGISNYQFEAFLSAQTLLVPPADLQARYSEITGACSKQIDVLANQSQKLTETRDLLLNRLISGKLRVDDLDIQFPPSMQDKAA